MQCLFAVNLHYLHVQNTIHQNDSVVPLHQHCWLRHQYNYARLFIKNLADIEKQRVALEKEFSKSLKLWNKLQPPPLPDVIPPPTNTKT